MRRDQDHRRPVTPTALDEPARKVETALLAEKDVDEDDVGPKRLGLAQRMFPAGCELHGEALSFQECACRGEEAGAVVDDEAAKCHAVSVAVSRAPRITASRNPGGGTVEADERRAGIP